MESAATMRKKARNIESEIMSRIAVRGANKVAAKIGIDESRISHWKKPGGLVERASLLLAAIDYQEPEGLVLFSGDETADLARGLIAMLEHIREPKTE